MPNVDIKLDGLEAIRKRLQEMGNTSNVANQVLPQAADLVINEAQSRVPRRRGKLQADITRGEVKDEKIMIGVKAKGADFYAHIVEFGSSRQPARPFMRPAYEVAKPQIEQLIAQAFRKELGL